MELERRTQQIKEVVRVSAGLRADMPAAAICAQVAQAIHATLGFRAVVVNLIAPGSRHFIIEATAGISEPERQRLINDPPPVDHILSVMNEHFQVSRSYFVSHEHKYLLEGAGGIMLLTPSALTPRDPNSWHPEDVFLVPLFSIRERRLLGVISLDLPEDGKIPSAETAEIIELLANQAAAALDTARLFQERDRERQALEDGLAELLAHLERMRQRDFSARAQLHGVALKPLAGALNDVSATLGNVLADVRDAGMVVQQQASEMRTAAMTLVEGAQQQAEQIRNASDAIRNTSAQMRQIVERAADSSVIAGDAEDISNTGRQAAEQAGQGMSAVREITLQAAKRIKHLGESSQEIGNVIQLVSEFASQTHLLALNAAIAAADAGEHGAGFAIVAREIRSLAQNSNDATKQIQARIKGIQNETNQVAVTIEHTTQQVVELSELVLRSGSALHAVDTAIQQIASVVATMHQTAAEQARATATISDTMNSIAGITGATWESAEQMRASMEHLAELATILQSKIEQFRLSEQLQADLNASLPSMPSTPSMPSMPSMPSTPSAASSAGQTISGSAPPAVSSSSPAAPANAAMTDTDMALLTTMPMPALPIASLPPRPPARDLPSTVETDTAKMALFTAPADAATGGDTPEPPQLFPVTTQPLAPVRLTALEETTTTTTMTAATSADESSATTAHGATADDTDNAGSAEPADNDADNDAQAAAPDATPTTPSIATATDDEAPEEAPEASEAANTQPSVTENTAEDTNEDAADTVSG